MSKDFTTLIHELNTMEEHRRTSFFRWLRITDPNIMLSLAHHMDKWQTTLEMSNT